MFEMIIEIQVYSGSFLKKVLKCYLLFSVTTEDDYKWKIGEILKCTLLANERKFNQRKFMKLASVLARKQSTNFLSY